jgi:putative ABC transport system ATP-binding protein
MSIIKLNDISKIYGTGEATTKALEGINLEFQQGETIAITGPSGSGKSTLLNILGCIDLPSSGQYILDGKLTSEYKGKQLAKVRNAKIGFIFQYFALINEYSVIENVQIPLNYRKISYKKSKILALDYLEKVNMKQYYNKKPTQLSGGQQQRVAIARALVGNPDIILADEPTGALDKQNGEEVMKLLTNLNAQGKTIIIITHDSNVASYCKRNIIIQDGKIISDKLTNKNVGS